IDHRHQVVAAAARLWDHVSTRPRCFRTEDSAVYPALLDCGLEENRIVGTRIEEQVPGQVLLGEVWVGFVEPIESTTAVADDHLQLGIALEYVPVTEELRRQVLLRVEPELIVMRHDAETAV